ncbi:uncharacterized protein LOC128868294 isoform X1 [Anastrepha ludens]|uniref:uncharacterized protein LOC128868294 isoform X1 n=1 Tax=Anastrepha ludens TaxID=28586 RepID=UPI0023B01927|nr:uncharacterized protein LOC128868294 isoform X1 [Anastrepha ludens]
METKGKEIGVSERNNIIKLWKDGNSFRNIGKTIGRTYSSVQRVVNNYKQTGILTSKPRSGRPTTLSVQEKRRTINTFNSETYNFDPSLSEEERRFYIRAYPNVDLVRERKVHCTICKMHIGTAPAQEEIIKMHPVLRVTHCLKCHHFYNSGEFSKGEDGSELYCRWCGQGGEVYCCSSCPYVFCKSCIVKNLSRGVVVDIEQNENWNCFSCAPKILWPLRAQHWALIRYIDKQKKYIESTCSTESDKKALMAQDRSTCCRLAKSKCGNMSDSLESLDSTTSRRSQSSAIVKKQSKSPHPQTPAAKRLKTSNDEVVCTPDLLSMLEPDCQITVQQKTRPTASPMTSTPKIISLQTNTSTPNSGGITLKPHNNNTPPPLVLRNTGIPMRHPSPAPIVRRTYIGARNTPSAGTHTPVYHTINGYRIDLNSAAQQETFRLPNGKLIQVKRQGTNQTQGVASSPTSSNPWFRQASPITAIQNAASSRPIQITPANSHATQQYYTVQQQQHNPMHHPQMIRYSNTTVTPISSQNGAVRGTQIQVINGMPMAPTAAPAAAPGPNVTTAIRAPLMVRHVFPDTAFGQARTQLQDQVFNAMEICQHLTGKVQTLTNSNAYKQARNYLEVKELYIHLSYLLTYAIGRFKGLQDKCLADMRQLGFVNDADSLENGQLAADKQASDDEDNEIEIVEPKTDTITLDSDNEDDEPAKQMVASPIKPQLIAINNNDTQSSNASLQCREQILTITHDGNSQKLREQILTITHDGNSQKLKEQLLLPKNTSITATIPMPSLTNIAPTINRKAITINEPNKMEEMDIMTAAKSFLVSLLEVDSDTAEGSWTPDGSDSTSQQHQRKQPRKKTTNKPNPTLLKQKEILERERLEEMKRNDLKLKMKCAISLKKAEEEFPFAKDMLQKHESETKTNAAAEVDKIEATNDAVEKASETKEPVENNEKMDDSGELEILTVDLAHAVVDLESSMDDGKENEIVLEEDKSPSGDKCEEEDNSKKYTIVMDDDDDDKEKSLIIEVEGNNSGEKESLKVVIDAKSVEGGNNSKWVVNDKTVVGSEKCTKSKVETVSECAKRVIEGLQASEKKKEMEKKEQQAVKVSVGVASSTTATLANVDDNVPGDDTVEPILIDESDAADSEGSPIKQNFLSKVEDIAAPEEEATTASTGQSSATKQNNDTIIDESTSAAELNEPEIDVEKEIEKLLMNKAPVSEIEMNAPQSSSEASTTAKNNSPELLSQLVDNLLESESTTLT